MKDLKGQDIGVGDRVVVECEVKAVYERGDQPGGHMELRVVNTPDEKPITIELDGPNVVKQ